MSGTTSGAELMAPARPGPARPAKLRVLIASHSHPELSNGGAEIAAFQLFSSLLERDDCEPWFLGCDRLATTERPGAVLSQPYSDREWIYRTGAFDWFKFANPDPRFRAEFERLLRELRPDVVHFHHYINFGVEALLHVRRVLPNCRIVLTLHEYLGICHHFGQMVTTKHLSLCFRASPARCNGCFPDIGQSDFYLRRRYIQRFLDLVDVFVSPSEFLAGRYVAWGIDPTRMRVLENLMPPAHEVSPLVVPFSGPLRFGFFGQISTLKGIDIVFAAAAALEADDCNGVSFEVFGDYRGQPVEFQSAFLDRLAEGGANIRYHGPYDRERVDVLMQSVHAVIVPSLWWENSPLVIQEALRNRRPVICSDIGGMTEKVRNGIDGQHFPAGDAAALARELKRLADDRNALLRLGAGLTGRAELVSRVEQYVALYRDADSAPGAAA